MPQLPSRLLALPALLLALLTLTSTAAASTPAQRIVSIARHEVSLGVHEIPDGSNRAPAIYRYDRATTPHWYGAPWCAYFVSYVARAAGVPIGPGGKGLGYVPYIRAWAKSTGRWHRTPRAGDLITFPEHVGIVESVFSNHTLTTIEGNAGNAVRRRWRRWGEAMGYVRVASGGAAPQSPASTPQPSLTPHLPKPLVARITAYPGSAIAVGQTITFTSDDSTGDVVRSDWDLDGNRTYESRGENVTRKYPKAGRYLVHLRVTDRTHHRKVATLRVIVRDDQPAVARFTVPAVIYAGQSFVADASSSADVDGRIVKYEWDLNGDGQWGTDGVRHQMTIAQPGDYDAGLRVTDDAGNVTEWHTNVHVSALPDPVSVIACDTDTIQSGGTVHCVADDSQSPTRIVKHEWDTNSDGSFGDGKGSRIWVTYRAPGDQAIRERVTDANGHTAIAVTVIHVLNRPPAAALSVPAKAAAGQPVTLDASASDDPDGTIVRYEWDLDGDGVYDQTTTAPTLQTTFATTGTQTVGVRVTDDQGATSAATADVQVLTGPTAAPRMTSTTATAGTTTYFSGSGSTDPDGSIVKYEWDFDGDGHYDRSSWRSSTSWWYSTPGTYQVGLRVTDSNGLTATATLQITVGVA